MFMISGMLNVLDCCKLSSHGRVSGYNRADVLEKVVYIEGKEEFDPVESGPDFNDCMFRDADECSQQVEKIRKEK